MDTDLNATGLFSMVCLQQSAANTECTEGSRSGASTAGHRNSKGGRSTDEVRGRHLGVGTAQDCHCRDRKWRGPLEWGLMEQAFPFVSNNMCPHVQTGNWIVQKWEVTTLLNAVYSTWNEKETVVVMPGIPCLNCSSQSAVRPEMYNRVMARLDTSVTYDYWAGTDTLN